MRARTFYLLAVSGIAAHPGFEHIEEVEEVLALWKEGAGLSEEKLRSIERIRRGADAFRRALQTAL